MKKIIKLSILFFASALVLASCSKYEDNSGVSLKSKTKRLVGEWKLTGYNSTETEAYGTTSITETYDYDGTFMTWREGTDSDRFSYTEKITINEDGTYKSETSYETNSYENIGIWSWLDGASEKEQIQIDGMIYVIKKLTKDELILQTNESTKSTIGTSISTRTTITTSTYSKQ